MRSRHEDALFIQEGACNPVAIAGTIHQHMLKMHRDKCGHDAIRTDPAIRLMIHQLAYLCHIPAMEHSPYCDMYMADPAHDPAECESCRYYQRFSYSKAMEDCRAAKKAAMEDAQ